MLRLVPWLAVCAAGGLTVWLVGTSDIADYPWPTAILGGIVGFAWCFTGLAAHERRPSNRTGRLMVLVGLAWLVALLQFSDVSLLYTIGLLVGALYLAALLHVLLAFPTGELRGRLARAVVVAGYVDATAVLAISFLFYDDAPSGVRDLALIEPDQGLADAISGFSSSVGGILFGIGLGIVAHRWRHGTPAWRRVVAPLLWSGCAAGAVAGLLLLAATAGFDAGPAQVAAVVVFGTVPFAFQVGLWRDRMARAAVADLVVELGRAVAPGGLRDALARALGDPSLAIAYWLPEPERYVDVEGRPLELPGPDDVRVATVIERGGKRVAALLHDASLSERPQLVDAACAAAGMALENERLQAELSARLVELQASRARIVEAGDAARRRIERDLHDGAQQRLVSISMTLGLAETKLAADPAATRALLTDARTGLTTALKELRELSQGIHPAILTERGLGPALQELAYRAPVPTEVAVELDRRLPPPVEAAAYFVVAESLANVAKHAAAEHVAVSVGLDDGRAVVEVADDGRGGADVSRGSGLRGLADRVDALGGTLAVRSEPGSGTQLRAEIPVG